MNPRCGRLLGVASLALACAATAEAVTIELKNSWMRPAAAGSIARVYVDIVSDAELVLVGATSTNARKAELVKVENLDGSDEGMVVKSMPVSAKEPTRLAYRGSYVRLVDVKKDLPNGSLVAVKLQFRDKSGKRYTAEAPVQVRGIVLRREGLPDDAPDGQSSAPVVRPQSAPGTATPAPMPR
jgi:copper(I)-binding protein